MAPKVPVGGPEDALASPKELRRWPHGRHCVTLGALRVAPRKFVGGPRQALVSPTELLAPPPQGRPCVIQEALGCPRGVPLGRPMSFWVAPRKPLRHPRSPWVYPRTPLHVCTQADAISFVNEISKAQRATH